MQKQLLDIRRINEIFEKTIEAIDKGRYEILDIADNARREYKRIKDELSELHKRIQVLINNVDNLEKEEKKARSKLMMVSKNFSKYTEDDIREAYEEANNARVRYVIIKQEEKELIKKRNELEINLKNTFEILKKAERLVSQVGVAMGYLKGNLNDISETIEDMNKRQYLGLKIIEAQEEERHRVSREIHDGPAQAMANVVLKAELCEKLLSIDENKVKKELRNLKEIVRSSLKEVRKIIFDLRPMLLDDLGLIPTIERYSQNFYEDTGIVVEFLKFGEQMEINSLIQIACFRIIQESLNNVRKHSKASRVMIKMESSLNRINIVIKDNGVGFDLNEINNSENLNESGFGIIGMKERVEVLNGNFEIFSGRGEGTKIMLTIPLKGEEETNEGY